MFGAYNGLRVNQMRALFSTFSKFLAAFTLLVLLSGCAGMFRYGPPINKESRSDFAIQSSLDWDFFALDVALYHQVSLKIFEGNVLLTGRVPTEELQQQMEKIAQKTPGVIKVYNQTTLGTSRDMSEYLGDAWLSTEIATKIFADSPLYPDHYAVETVDGIVYLMGRAEDEAERQKVVDMARRFEGVTKVISFIEIKPLKKT